MGYERILLTLDGSQLAELALQQLAGVAKPGADIHILSVVEDQLEETSPLVSLMNAEFALSSTVHPPLRSIDMQPEIKVRMDYLEQVGKDLKDQGYRVAFEACGGKVVDTIANVAGEGFEVLVMATHGRTGLSKFVLGSVAEAVLHRAPCPVLLVPAHTAHTYQKEQPTPYGCILVALDGSLESEVVLPEVEKLLQTQPGKVVLLRVGPIVDLDGAARQMDAHVERASELPSDDYELLSNVTELQIRRYLDAIGKRLEPTACTTVVEVSFNKPTDEILFFAKHYGADLIAMATHGRTGFNRLLHGSVTENVLHHAPCPILVVRTPDRPLARFAPEN